MINVVDDNMYAQLKQMYNWDAWAASRAKARLETMSASDYNKMVGEINNRYGSTSTSNTSTSTPKVSNTWTTSTSNSGTSSTPKNTSTNTTSSSYTVKPEYWGQGTTANVRQPQDTSWDKGNTTYTYNPQSWYYEAKPQSSNVSWTPTKWDQIREWWNNMTPEQQQEALAKHPNLANELARYGITTPKSWTPTTPQDTTWNDQWNTPKPWDEWDYQDNSQARMDEIADNLNRYRVTNPELFDNWDAFRNFFIDWKGRTPEQEKFLTDYFNLMKKYSQYDNKPSDQVWYDIAHWYIPEEYLNWVKYSDPQRYAEIQEARKQSEIDTMNEWYLSTIAEQAWFEMWDSDRWKWNTSEMWYRDANKDWLDDRLYHEPTEEEKKLWEEDASYEAERLKIQNAYKWLQDDLTDQYPDADLSTIMLLTWDRGNKMLKALDTLNVSQTKVQWMIKYMQNERDMQNQAGQQTIAELQKNYWMYLQSPEWLTALTKAEYAANNITLDQADNGTDTDKQMALDRVLSDYYDKYWSIIQRSKSQVINDVMAYAKNHWVSLSKALEENFVKPLRSKPEFDYISSWWISPQVTFEKVGDTWYIFTVNPDWTYSIDTIGGAWVTYWSDWVPKFWQDIRTWDTIGNDINSIGHILASDDWLRVGTYYNKDNWYTYNVYANREDWIKATENLLKRSYYWMSLADAAQKWIWQWKDISTAKQVIKDKGLSLNDTLSDANVRKFIEAIWQWEWTLKWKSLDDWLNETPNNDFSDYKKENWEWEGGGDYDPLLKEFFQMSPTKLTDQQWKKIKNMGYNERTYLQMRDNYLKWLAKEPDGATVKILDTLWFLMTNYPWRNQLMTSRWTQYLPWQYGQDMWNYLSYLDYIKQNLTMDNLMKLKQGWATFGSLTEGERPRIESSASRLSNTMSEELFLSELLDIYNTYATKSWMWELTLDDIKKMYGSSGNSTTTFNAPSYVTNPTWAWNTASLENRDEIYAQIS